MERKMMDFQTFAFQLGSQAWHIGQSRDKNPYKHGTSSARNWVKGWELANGANKMAHDKLQESDAFAAEFDRLNETRDFAERCKAKARFYRHSNLELANRYTVAATMASSAFTAIQSALMAEREILAMRGELR